MNAKFPKDCPAACPHLTSWDLSIDDITNQCDLLHKQIDDCDWDSPFCPFCPLSEEEYQKYVDANPYRRNGW